MSITTHHLYPMYLEYIKSYKRRTHGQYELMKFSQEAFFEFKYKYDTNEKFRKRQDEAIKSIIRENKINDLIDDKSD
jgi:hypothetical protein